MIDPQLQASSEHRHSSMPAMDALLRKREAELYVSHMQNQAVTFHEPRL